MRELCLEALREWHQRSPQEHVFTTSGNLGPLVVPLCRRRREPVPPLSITGAKHSAFYSINRRDRSRRVSQLVSTCRIRTRSSTARGTTQQLRVHVPHH